MTALKKVNIARNGYVFISVVFYIAGLLNMVWQWRAPPLVYCIISGIILIAYGIIKIIGYLSDDLYCLAFQYDLGCGLFLIVAGILVLGCNLRIWQYLPTGLGFLILLDSLMNIQMSKDARAFGLESWKTILILSVIAGIFGVLIVVRPFQNMNMVHIVTGCGLLTEGALNHLVVRKTASVTKRHALPDKNREEQKMKSAWTRKGTCGTGIRGGSKHGCINDD